MSKNAFGGKQETVETQDNEGKQQQITRLRFKVDEKTFVFYHSENAWMNGMIFRAEYSRISKYLKCNHPKQKFALCLDNATCHKIVSTVDSQKKRMLIFD